MKVIIECESKEMTNFIIGLSQSFKIKKMVPEINDEYYTVNEVIEKISNAINNAINSVH